MKTVVSILVTAVFAAGATYVVVSSGNKSGVADLKEQHEKALSKLKSTYEGQLTSARRKSGGYSDGATSTGASRPSAPHQIIIDRSPVEVLQALPGHYGSNDRLAQRRRIFLTEMLVDIGPAALVAIENVLNDVDADYEPDLKADRLKRTASRYGVTSEHATQLAQLIKDMKPKMDEEGEKS